MKQWSDGVVGVAKYKLLPHVSGEKAFVRADQCSRCEHLQIRAMPDFEGVEGFVVKTLYKYPLLGVCGLCDCPVMAEPNEGSGTVNFSINGKPFSLIPEGKTVTLGAKCDADKWP